MERSFEFVCRCCLSVWATFYIIHHPIINRQSLYLTWLLLFLVAEKVFKKLAELSTTRPEVHYIAVSHSSPEATERWVVQVGGNWDVEVIVDWERELYAQWGLGVSNTWHVLNPLSLYNVIRLGKDEGIWNRPTESGSRWQTGGAFAVDSKGVVKWAKVAASADDVPDLDAALTALGLDVKTKKPPARTEGFL
jgi:hypothetical protein